MKTVCYFNFSAAGAAAKWPSKEYKKCVQGVSVYPIKYHVINNFFMEHKTYTKPPLKITLRINVFEII